MTITIDDAPVKLLLSGIFKSGKTVFFKVDSTGKHEKVNVGLILRTLNLSHGAVSRLIAAFPWPELKYYSDAMRKADAARGKPREKRPRLTRTSDNEADQEEIAEDETEEDGPSDKKCQYSLVHQNNGYWGCYDGREATVVLFKTKSEAQEHLQDILHGRDGYHISYGGMGNRSRSHAAAEIHY
jgi:hypothetical protein